VITCLDSQVYPHSQPQLKAECQRMLGDTPLSTQMFMALTNSLDLGIITLTQVIVQLQFGKCTANHTYQFPQSKQYRPPLQWVHRQLTEPSTRTLVTSDLLPNRDTSRIRTQPCDTSPRYSDD